MNKILLIIFVVTLLLSSCNPVRTYEITLDDGQVIEVTYFRCSSNGFAVECYNGTSSSPDVVYYNVSSLRKISETR